MEWWWFIIFLPCCHKMQILREKKQKIWAHCFMNTEQYWFSQLKNAELWIISHNFFGIPARNQEDKTKLLYATVHLFAVMFSDDSYKSRFRGLVCLKPLAQRCCLCCSQFAGSKERDPRLPALPSPPASPWRCYCSHSAPTRNTETFMMPGAEEQKHLGAVRVTVPRTVLTKASRTNLLTVPFSSQRFPQWRHSHRDEFPSCHSSWQWPRCECCHHVFHVSASGSVLPDQSQHRLGVCEPPDLPGNDSLLEWSNPRTHHRGSWFAQNTLQISFIFFIS